MKVLQFPKLCRLVRRSIASRMKQGACRDPVAAQYGVSVRWLGLFVALIIAGCASAPVSPHAPPPVEADNGAGLQLIAQILADACTARATDAILVEHATFLLKACHLNVHACLRKVCVRLGQPDEDDELQMARTGSR